MPISLELTLLSKMNFSRAGVENSHREKNPLTRARTFWKKNEIKKEKACPGKTRSKANTTTGAKNIIIFDKAAFASIYRSPRSLCILFALLSARNFIVNPRPQALVWSAINEKPSVAPAIRCTRSRYLPPCNWINWRGNTSCFFAYSIESIAAAAGSSKPASLTSIHDERLCVCVCEREWMHFDASICCK